MKYILKGDEPQSFTDWKNNDKMYQRGKPSWNRFSHSKYKKIKSELIESLKKEQGYICCYCEVELKKNDYHPEHIKPKSKNNFPELQLEYDNLLCSYQLELDKGEPKQCGNSKADNIIPITPLQSNCENKFTYTEDGYIESTDDDSKETIIHLQLDINKLNTLRREAIEPFIIDPITLDEISKEEAKIFAENYLKQKDGKFNEFYTTIKYLFT